MFKVKLRRTFPEQDLFSTSGTAVRGVAPHRNCSQCLAQRSGIGLPVAPNWAPVVLTFLAWTGTHPVPKTLCFMYLNFSRRLNTVKYSGACSHVRWLNGEYSFVSMNMSVVIGALTTSEVRPHCHTWFVSKVSVLIFYLNVYWTHLKLQVISFKVWPLGSYTAVPAFFPLIIAVPEVIFCKCV